MPVRISTEVSMLATYVRNRICYIRFCIYFTDKKICLVILGGTLSKKGQLLTLSFF